MRQTYIVEIQPDGRAALRIAIVADEKDTYPPTHAPPGAERGVVEIPMYEEPTQESPGVIVWKM